MMDSTEALGKCIYTPAPFARQESIAVLFVSSLPKPAYFVGLRMVDYAT